MLTSTSDAIGYPMLTSTTSHRYRIGIGWKKKVQLLRVPGLARRHVKYHFTNDNQLQFNLSY
jgi:hypothetical protein